MDKETIAKAEILQQQQDYLLHCHEDVMLMAEYAISICVFPKDARYEDICALKMKIQCNRDLEKTGKRLLRYKKEFSSILAPVTADSLRYTDRKNKNNPPYDKVFIHLKRLYALSITTISIIVVVNLLKYVFNTFGSEPGEAVDATDVLTCITRGVVDHIYPFLYGLLGSCMYLLRMSGVHLRKRNFDICRISEHWNRVPLGVICGGIVSLFVTTEVSTAEGNIVLSQGALGFLAGYSVDLVFSAIDRVKNSIIPPSDSEEETERLKKLIQTKSDEEIDQLKKLVPSKKDEVVKNIIKLLPPENDEEREKIIKLLDSLMKPEPEPENEEAPPDSPPPDAPQEEEKK